MNVVNSINMFIETLCTTILEEKLCLQKLCDATSMLLKTTYNEQFTWHLIHLKTFIFLTMYFHVYNMLEGCIKFWKEVRSSVKENVKKNIFSNCSLKFSYNFWIKTSNLKWIFGDEPYFDFSSLYSSKFFEKKHFTMCKWSLKILFVIQFLHFSNPIWFVLPLTVPLV